MRERLSHIEHERAALAEIGEAFTLKRPKTHRAPLIFASPHSGKIYPKSFLARSRHDLLQLRANEDAFIDTLFAPAADIGAPLLSARFPRCYVDVNRAPTELPPGWGDDGVALTPRAEAGFGVIPTMIAQGTPIYKAPLERGAAALRLRALYHPYHGALREEISQALECFGRAVVLDCHSMPGVAAMGARRADIVLGDRFGLSCSPRTIDIVERAFRSCGYSVVRNYPYAGGYVTTHYGRSAARPMRDIETVQIEINRDLYLNAVTLKPKPKGFAKLSRDIHDIIWTLTEALAAPRELAAAE